MPKVIARRILGAIPLLVIVSFSVFVMIALAPGDPAQTLAGEGATVEQVQALRKQLGLDRPLPTRYVEWVGHLLHGNLGTSILQHEPVSRMLTRSGSVTLSLLVVSLVLSLVVGTTLAVLAAMKPFGLVDRLVLVIASLGISLPAFWVGVMVSLLFSVKLGWLPAVGYEPLSAGFTTWLSHLIMPAGVLSIVTGAEITRQLRSSLVDALNMDYILAARARGTSHRAILCKHAMKNAAAPVITITGYRVAQMIGAAVIVEYTFAMNGLGSLAVDSAQNGDLPMILGIVVTSLIAVVIINVIVDLSYGYFNPRVRT